MPHPWAPTSLAAAAHPTKAQLGPLTARGAALTPPPTCRSGRWRLEAHSEAPPPDLFLEEARPPSTHGGSRKHGRPGGLKSYGQPSLSLTEGRPIRQPQLPPLLSRSRSGWGSGQRLAVSRVGWGHPGTPFLPLSSLLVPQCGFRVQSCPLSRPGAEGTTRKEGPRTVEAGL